MSSQDLISRVPDVTLDTQETVDRADSASHHPTNPPGDRGRLAKGLSPFWHDRLIEVGLILSMALYYVIGNVHLGKGYPFQLNPLFSIPFLLIFAVLCWYRLTFALALLPLTLPYYLQQKTVISHYSFSLAEITLAVCLVVALLQLLRPRRRWDYSQIWRDLRDRLGPFSIPILIFFLAAAFSIVIAYSHVVALRAFREEVWDPLLYLLLALIYLRSRQDVTRLLVALLGTGFVIALLGLTQYFFFRNLLVLEPDGIRRVHAMYGSANDIGLLYDYVLPIGLALVVAKTLGALASWRLPAFATAVCVPLLFVLYLSQSRGAWFAIAVAVLFIAALSIRNRKVLIVSGLIIVIIMSVVVFVFHTRIADFIIGGHTNVNGVSTVTRRLSLWQSALNMLHDSPWFGYGMDNWLCHYSANLVCHTPHLFHYWNSKNIFTGAPLVGLHDEPTLSHPHNIFLQVWVSMGLFGLLAFVAIIGLFFWLFARILVHLRSSKFGGSPYLHWMTVGVGAAMLAALVHGLFDSSFLEQDLAFCFWMLITALLLVRSLSGTPWRGWLKQEQEHIT